MLRDPTLVLLALLTVCAVAELILFIVLLSLIGNGSGQENKIIALLMEIKSILRQRLPVPEPRHFEIHKIGEDTMPTDNSIVAGTSGHFVATPQPTGSAVAAGQPVPKWVASDPAVSLAPSADGLSVDAAVPASDTGASFTLGISYTRKDGALASGSVTVTIVQPTPPPVQEPTSFTIAQTS